MHGETVKFKRDLVGNTVTFIMHTICVKCSVLSIKCFNVICSKGFIGEWGFSQIQQDLPPSKRSH